jgi:hypothetical protein
LVFLSHPPVLHSQIIVTISYLTLNKF